MNFLADESVDYNIFKILKKSGYNIEHVLDIFPGEKDDRIMKYAYENDRVIITEDKDFGELAIRFKLNTKGIILLRFISISTEEKGNLILNAFAEHGKEMYNSLTVISDKKIRVKKIDNH